MIVRQVTPLPSNGFATSPIDLEIKESHKRFIAVVCLFILILEAVIFLTKKSLQMKRNYTDLQNGWENRYVEMLGVVGVFM